LRVKCLEKPFFLKIKKKHEKIRFYLRMLSRTASNADGHGFSPQVNSDRYGFLAS